MKKDPAQIGEASVESIHGALWRMLPTPYKRNKGDLP